VTAWLREGRAPTREEAERTLRHPIRQAAIAAVFWAAAIVGFVALNAPYSTTIAIECAVEITLAGLTTCAVTYLLTERITRPIVARALVAGLPDCPAAPSVGYRFLLVWTFGSAVPLIGLILLGAALLDHLPASHVSVGLAIVLLASIGVVVGLLTVWITARMVADPLRTLRQALARVERGELDTAVEVDDASEVGRVQAAFNRMVHELRERDRLRDLFGRHVGEEVVKSALAREEIELGGEAREAAVLFVDVIGSTALAASRDPGDVVAQLNAFFAIVVDCVSLHGGWVNKFEGDAALCVFGAPTAHPDAAGSALATARALSTRLRRELPGSEAAIGVSAGQVVAGNIGAAERFEYTVIGDPVNEAARLTELAKGKPSRVLASDAALSRAGESERERWSIGSSVTLRGRSTPTTVASPLLPVLAAPGRSGRTFGG
jgi:adenylate cyclase